jgi:pyrroline-5-carboxylate reductase
VNVVVVASAPAYASENASAPVWVALDDAVSRTVAPCIKLQLMAGPVALLEENGMVSETMIAHDPTGSATEIL